MEYSRYVGRVGALAVALGIGVAIANGGIANATTDPDPPNEPGNSDTSPSGSESTDNNPGTGNSQTSDAPDTPDTAVGADTAGGSDTQNPTTEHRQRPRVMFLDVLRGDNIARLGSRHPAASDTDSDPVERRVVDAPQRTVDLGDGPTVADVTAPTAPAHLPPTPPTVKVLQRTLRAVTAPPQQKTDPAPKPLLNQTNTVGVAAPSEPQAQRQAAITTLSTVPAPAVAPLTPKPGNVVINLLSSIGLRPDAFPSGSPLAPIGQVLEFVYAGLRRFDRTVFNETPTATPLIIDTDTKTGVVTGRVATDYEGDALTYTMIDGPDHGDVVLNPDGTFTYTANRDETRDVAVTDQFTVEVSDKTNVHLHLFSPAGHTTTVTVSGITVGPNNTVIGTVDTGGQPEDLAINSTGTRLYVSDQDLDKVHVIDTSTNTIVASIPVSQDPDGLAVVKTPDGKEYVYVASSRGVLGDPTNTSDDIVSIIDTSTNTVVATIDLSPPSPTPTVAGPQEVAASSDGTKVYVTGYRAVYVIDTATKTKTATIPMSSLANSIAVARTPAGDFAYVADYDGKVTVINMATDTKVTEIAVPGFNSNVAASPDGRYVYVSGDGVTVIDTQRNEVVATIDEVTDPRGLTVSPDGSRLYVTRINFDEVAVIDTATNTVVDNVPLESAWNIVASPGGTRVYAVAWPDDPNVSVIAVQAPAIEV